MRAPGPKHSAMNLSGGDTRVLSVRMSRLRLWHHRRCCSLRTPTMILDRTVHICVSVYCSPPERGYPAPFGPAGARSRRRGIGRGRMCRSR